jgi:hypothetical protein
MEASADIAAIAATLANAFMSMSPSGCAKVEEITSARISVSHYWMPGFGRGLSRALAAGRLPRI